VEGSVDLWQAEPMPELPEVTALAAFLTEHAGGQRITAVSVAALNVLTTYDPPASALSAGP
jgi:formamidopyrimidine-DNA glycosylase